MDTFFYVWYVKKKPDLPKGDRNVECLFRFQETALKSPFLVRQSGLVSEQPQWPLLPPMIPQA